MVNLHIWELDFNVKSGVRGDGLAKHMVLKRKIVKSSQK
jgi:hypothetical protein